MKDQVRARHQIEHRRDDRAVKTRRLTLAKFGKSLLVLRPKAMDHERIGPRSTLLLVRPIGSTIAGRLTKRRRPGQCQNIEIELTGLVLTSILRGSKPGREQKNNGERDRLT